MGPHAVGAQAERVKGLTSKTVTPIFQFQFHTQPVCHFGHYNHSSYSHTYNAAMELSYLTQDTTDCNQTTEKHWTEMEAGTRVTADGTMKKM